uniref:NADH dehydrogenase subunit 6 n=1 Tax=Elassoma alabamae TaxID=138670 RepID=UPI0023D84573|nr:NADH dehydrogenase subunit 6 [Elassoma alabamae]WCZ71046.1 NADH dehydrogenase subunit 6 [Elassoma alabamae]
MTYVMFLLTVGLVLGLVGVASNPSPYFAALGLVLVAGVGCGLLASYGGAFLSLVLFLIYLGGMLVVFAYSAALAAEPYPESWGSRSVLVYMAIYLVVVVLAFLMFWGGWYDISWTCSCDISDFMAVYVNVAGVGMMYSLGGMTLLISAWVLLLTLFVVLELTRGLSRVDFRAI